MHSLAKGGDTANQASAQEAHSVTASEPLIGRRDISKTAGAVSIAAAGDLSLMALNYVTGVIVTRSLGAGLYGVYALSIRIVNLFGAGARLGLDTGTLRYVSKYRATGDVARTKGLLVFSTAVCFAASVALALVLWTFSNFLEQFVFKEPELGTALRIVSISIPAVVLQMVWLGALQGYQAIRERILIEKLLQPLFRLGLLTVFFVLGLSLPGVLWAGVFAGLFSVGLTLVLLQRVFAPQQQQGPTKFEAWEWLSFSLPLLPYPFLTFFLGTMDILLLGVFRQSSEVGLYNAALRLAPFVVIPLWAANMIFAPMISEMYSKNELQRLENFFKLITKWVFAVSFPIALTLMIFGESILAIFGSGFVIASTALSLLALSRIFDAGVGAVGHMLMMTGHSSVSLVNSLLMVGLSLALNLLLIPRHGIIGAAVTAGITVAGINLLRLLEVHFLLKIHPYRFDFLKPVFAGGLTGLVFFFLHKSFISFYAWSEIVGIFFIPFFLGGYFLVLFLLGLSPEDKLIIDIARSRLDRLLGRA